MTSVELPPRLSTVYLLKLEDPKPAASDLAIEEARDRLASCGVEDASSASEDDVRAALARIEGDPEFWRTHHTLHPNGKRVKNWLWVHSKYRDQANGLLALEDVSAMKKAFGKLEKKIKSHSEFEDTQLFKFFQDAKIGDQEAFQRLNEDHGDLRTEGQIAKAFDDVQPEGDASYEKMLKPLLQKYVDDLMGHLEREERAVIAPWLQLSDTEFKQFQKGLSWTYWMMYG